MASAFATYLGPYNYSFRRAMITVHWPKCLDERGVPLVVDSTAPYPDAELFKVERLRKKDSDVSGETATVMPTEEEGVDENGNYEGREEREGGDKEGDGDGDGNGGKERADEEGEKPNEEVQKQDVEQNEKEEQGKRRASSRGFQRPKLSEYDSFTMALAKLLLGDRHIRRLLTKGMGPRKIENATLAKSSWQRAPLLIDPSIKSLELIRMIEDGGNVLEIDLAER